MTKGDIPGTTSSTPGTDPFESRMTAPSGAAVVQGLCGAEMEFYLDIDERQIITRATYWTPNGCRDTRMCARAVAECVQGLSIWDALIINPRQVIDAQPELSSQGRHCAILAVTTLYRAIADYLLKP